MKFIHYIEKVTNVDIMGVVSLTACVLFFSLMVIWVFKTKKKKFTEVSQLPLDN
jgi:vancomycin permeability regulator SanA